MRVLTEREILVILRKTEEKHLHNWKETTQVHEKKYASYARMAVRDLRKTINKFLNKKYDQGNTKTW